MTVLGVDYGERRIGLAITDKLEMIASPLETIPNDGACLRRLKDIAAEHEVDTIVVGLPLNMNGSLGPSGEKAKRFAEKLRAELAAEVVTFDERLTTVQAERAMLRHDISRAKRRKRRDEMAAQILLQTYLDSSKSARETAD